MINLSAERRELLCAGAIFSIALTLPLRSGISTAAIITALAAALAFGDREAMSDFFRKPLGIFLLVYLLLVFVFCCIERKFSMLERSSIILAIPFTCFVVQLSALRLRQLLRLYILTITGLVLYNVGYAVLHYPKDVFLLYEFSGELARFEGFPTNYIALHASFVCIMLFDSFFGVRLFKRVPGLLLFMVVMGYLMILGSRTAFFMSIVIMMGRVCLLVFQTRSWKAMLLAGVFVIIAVMPVVFVPYFKQRIVTLYTVGFEADARYYEYAAALNVFKQSPWFGNGHEHSEEMMVEQYQQVGFHEGVAKRYNAHNQILQTLIDYGVFGLVIVIVLFVLSVRAALRTRNFLPVAFVVLFTMCSLTESLLSRNRGITFYALFVGAFLVRPEAMEAYYQKKV